LFVTSLVLYRRLPRWENVDISILETSIA